MPTGLMIRVPPWRTPTGQSGGAERSPGSVHDRCQLLQILVSGFEAVAWQQMPCDGSPEYPTLGSQWATQGVAIRPTRSGQAWRIRSGRRRGRYHRDSVIVPSQRTHRSFTAKIAKNAKNIAKASHVTLSPATPRGGAYSWKDGGIQKPVILSEGVRRPSRRSLRSG